MLSGGIDNFFDNNWDKDSLLLLDGILHGFKIVNPLVDIPSYECINYSSATGEAYQFMNDIIERELAIGKLSVVDRKPHCVNALGAVEKSSGGYRPITDASKPDDISINNFMSHTFNNFKFCNIDQICESLTPGCFLAVTDVEAAYRTCMIRPGVRKFQGLAWEVGGS